MVSPVGVPVHHLLRLLVLVALVAGCNVSRAPAPGGAVVASAAQFVPRFGDGDPTDWPGRAPWAYQVHGIDLSRWQTDVDWRAARQSGVSFAFIKATEGGDHVDPAFDQHWRDAAAAGVARGAYHFFYLCRPAAEQAEWFIRNVPRDRNALPPVLDMEWTPFSPTCTRRPPPEVIRAEAQEFLRRIERHYGRRPLIYTTPEFYRTNEMGRLGYPMWLRAVADHPSTVYPGQDWAFWQYTGTGRVPGFSGDVDINAFRGSRADWIRFAGG